MIRFVVGKPIACEFSDLDTGTPRTITQLHLPSAKKEIDVAEAFRRALHDVNLEFGHDVQYEIREEIIAEQEPGTALRYVSLIQVAGPRLPQAVVDGIQEEFFQRCFQPLDPELPVPASPHLEEVVQQMANFARLDAANDSATTGSVQAKHAPLPAVETLASAINNSAQDFAKANSGKEATFVLRTDSGDVPLRGKFTTALVEAVPETFTVVRLIDGISISKYRVDLDTPGGRRADCHDGSDASSKVPPKFSATLGYGEDSAVPSKPLLAAVRRLIGTGHLVVKATVEVSQIRGRSKYTVLAVEPDESMKAPAAGS